MPAVPLSSEPSRACSPASSTFETCPLPEQLRKPRPHVPPSPPGNTESCWRLRLARADRKSTRLNSSHRCISYAVFCLKKKNKKQPILPPESHSCVIGGMCPGQLL